MPEMGVPLTPQADLLTSDEVRRVARVFVQEGVRKVRLTGGEPTLRRDIVDIIRNMDQLRCQQGEDGKTVGLESIGITTNGLLLRSKLKPMVNAGLDALNISLDTLDPYKFQIMTRRLGFERVLESIDLALAHLGSDRHLQRPRGLKSVKLNCVVMRGVNHEEVVDFCRFVKDRDMTVRFIEYMPFDGNKWNTNKMVPYRELISLIEKELGPMKKLTDDPNDTSKTYQLKGHRGRIGFITSMSDHFCGSCNRLRITADGNLKVCLFGNAEVSLRDLMRQQHGEDDEELIKVISAAVKRKHFSHAGMDELARRKNRPMILIGG